MKATGVCGAAAMPASTAAPARTPGSRRCADASAGRAPRRSASQGMVARPPSTPLTRATVSPGAFQSPATEGPQVVGGPQAHGQDVQQQGQGAGPRADEGPELDGEARVSATTWPLRGCGGGAGRKRAETALSATTAASAAPAVGRPPACCASHRPAPPPTARAAEVALAAASRRSSRGPPPARCARSGSRPRPWPGRRRSRWRAPGRATAAGPAGRGARGPASEGRWRPGRSSRQARSGASGSGRAWAPASTFQVRGRTARPISPATSAVLTPSCLRVKPRATDMKPITKPMGR